MKLLIMFLGLLPAIFVLCVLCASATALYWDRYQSGQDDEWR